MKSLKKVLAMLCIILLFTDICLACCLSVYAREYYRADEKLAVESLAEPEMSAAETAAQIEETQTDAAAVTAEAQTDAETEPETEGTKAALETEATAEGAAAEETQKAPETEAAAEGESQNGDTAETIEAAPAAAQVMTYEDDEVKVNVTAVTPGAIPGNASLKVVPIVEKTPVQGMSEAEIAKINAVNAQYKEVAEKLAEKAENEEYDIAGFLAYDITFVDQAGNKVEPNGEVKVSMEYKEAVIPEEAASADKETTDVTVMHLEEDANGQVKEIVDMVADEKTEASVQTTENAEVEKTEFVTDSFSTFTITWKNRDGWWVYEARITVNYVDTKGNVLELPPEDIPDSLNMEQSAIAIDLESYKRIIPGYTCKRICAEVPYGPDIRKIRKHPREHKIQYLMVDAAGEGDAYWTTWLNYTDASKSGNIYIVYEKNDTGPIAATTDKPLTNEKYVKDNGDGTYDLTLNVSAYAGTLQIKPTLDVLFVLDISNSMNTTLEGSSMSRLEAANEAIGSAVSRIKDNADVEGARYSLVTFGGLKGGRYTDASTVATWVDGNTLTSRLNDRNTLGATNYEAGLRDAKALLTTARGEAIKVVAFISDGDCTQYYEDDGTTAGKENEYDWVAMKNAREELQGMTGMDYFYTVGIGPEDSYKHLSELLEVVPDRIETGNYIGTGTTELGSALAEIVDNAIDSATRIPCSNVNVTDTLSENAELSGADAKLEIVVKQRNTTVTENPDGTVTTSTSLSEVEPAKGSDNKPLVQAGTMGEDGNMSDASFTLPGTDLNAQTELTAHYDKTNKQITLNFPTEYEPEGNYIYYVRTKIKPTKTAYNKVQTSGYTDTGEAKTDENPNADSTGQNTMDGTVSSGQEGFFCNTKATVSADYNGKFLHTYEYPKPVIKIKTDTGGGDTPPAPSDQGPVSKAKYIKYNKADGTYDLTLNVSGTSSEEKPKLDIVLVLDNSVSMGVNFLYPKPKLEPMETAVMTMMGTVSQNADVKWQVISFNGGAENRSNNQWTSDTAAAQRVVDNIPETSTLGNRGTNYAAALDKAKAALDVSSGRSGRKIVIFVTDGRPEYWQGIDQTMRQPFYDGLDAAERLTNCHEFYAVGIELEPGSYPYGEYKNVQYGSLESYEVLKKITAKVPISEADKQTMKIEDVTTTELSEKLSGISDSILHNCTGVSITDSFTKYVTLNTGSRIKVTMKDEEGNVVAEGTSERDLTTADLENGATFPVALKKKTDNTPVTTATVTYTPDSSTEPTTNGSVTLAFPTDYALEGGMVYDITMNISPTGFAENEYIDKGGYMVDGKPFEGAPGTDAPEVAPENHTSEGHPGFPSNSSATLNYTYDNEPKSEEYAHPVVQVSTESIEIVKKWADADNAYGRRTAIKFKVQQRVDKESWTEEDWTDYREVELSEAHADQEDGSIWRLPVTDLPPRNRAGEDLVYRAVEVEASVPEGYTASYDSQGRVTNTLAWKMIKQSTADKDGNHELLSGAVFRITKADGTVICYGKSGTDGEISFFQEETCETSASLPDGENYVLEEIKAPPQYALDGTKWKLSVIDGVPRVENPDGTVKWTYDSTEHCVVIAFDNVRFYELPNAGGPGIYRYLIGGVLFMIAAVLILYKNKRGEVLRR